MRHGELGVMGLPDIVLPACGHILADVDSPGSCNKAAASFDKLAG
jgi:hypothetical protein